MASDVDQWLSGGRGGDPDVDAWLSGSDPGRSLGGFLSNAWENTSQRIGEFAQKITSDPVGVVKDVTKLGIGTVQAAVPGMQEYERTHAIPYWSGIGKDIGFYKTPEGYPRIDTQTLAKTAYERPFDLAMDVSAFTAPASGLPGKVGRGAAMIDPLTMAGRGVTTVAKAPAKVAKYITGEYSGLGPRAISEAYRSGRAGGSEGLAFREGMRDIAYPGEPVDMARGAVGQLRSERGAAYQQGMGSTVAVTNRLDFAPIDKAFGNTNIGMSWRGKTADPKAAAVRKEISTVLDEWRSDPGAWTVEGFDKLKQRIQDIGQRQQYGTAESKLAGQVANAIKSEIKKQAPEYAKVMRAYERASNLIDELTRTFSLGAKSSYDTALRKLQSILRNNAFTNWTARARLAEEIQKRSPELGPMLSGQAASAVLPRGLPGKLLAGGGQIAGLIGAIYTGNVPAAIAILAAAPFASPRVVGEITHAAGRVRGVVDRIPRGVKAMLKTGTALSLRQQGIDHAESVLSSPVLDYIKKSHMTRGKFNDWLKARVSGVGLGEATRSLSESIAVELQKPELADRIFTELSQARGP